MSNGELTRLVSEGRDSLTEEAARALSDELKARGLDDDLLAFEYPIPKPASVGEDKAPKRRLREALMEDVRKLRPWQIIVVVVAFAFTITPVILRQREAKQDELYRKVLISAGTPESHSAFNQLITYHGTHARQLVLKLATDRYTLLGDTTQTDAIAFLGKTGDSQAADRLALLIRPYQGVGVRFAAADSLLNLPCSRECVRLVIDYEERMWRGDLSLETMFGKEIPEEIRERDHEIDEKLDRVLLNNKRDTLRSLVEIYGLGRKGVSPFALQLIRELKLTEACPFMEAQKDPVPIEDERTLFPRVAEAREQMDATKGEVCQDLPINQP